MISGTENLLKALKCSKKIKIMFENWNSTKQSPHKWNILIKKVHKREVVEL